LNGRGWILKEGYPFVAPGLVLAVIGFALGWPILGGFGLILAAAVALFFRNPSRRPLQVPGAATAPADGRIVEIKPPAEPREDEHSGWKVSIFMSVLNVHVNRSPVDGDVVEIVHRPGRFRPAYLEETSGENERNVLRLRMADGRQVTCVQVAGVLARRIVCWTREQAHLVMGEPFGMIRFGSRVDCFLPEDFNPQVRPGQRVRAGVTVLGYFDAAEKRSDPMSTS
jgi:phosphatidylserine decarboxylase